MKQPKWDKYETALLIEAYWKTKEDRSQRSLIISELSSFLRQRVSFEIDEIFRNENGINLRLGELEYIFSNGSSGVKNTSELFREMAELYLTRRSDFEKILNDAKSMSALALDTRTRFCDWLEKNAPKARIDITCWALSIGEEFCIKIKVLSSPLYETIDYEIVKRFVKTVTNNKIFRIRNRKQYSVILDAANKYLAFIRVLPELEFETKDDMAEDDAAEFGAQSEIIKRGDCLLNFFEAFQVQYPNLVFTNRNAKDELVNRALYIYPADGGRRGNVLFEIWHLSTEGQFDLYIRREFLTAEEYNESLEKWDKTTDSRGRITRTFRTSNELTDFVLSKIDNAQNRINEENQNAKSFLADIEQLLKARFKYGFRLTSDMDIMRMRQFAEMSEILLPESDETLKMLISSVGFKVEDKVFVISDETIDFLKSVVEKYSETGTQVFFYEALMAKEYDDFMENQISSEEMLKELLMKHCSGYTFSKNFMALGAKQTENDAIANELIRVWGNSTLHTFDELSELLPMIPLERIKYRLAYSELFVWNSHETYAYAGNVVISEEEGAAIIDFVRSNCEINGFASLSDVPLGAIAEVNYELSNTALYAVIFSKVLLGKFNLTGKILTFPGKSLSAVFLVKSFCADKDQCTFDELHDKVVELTGGTNRQIAFEAGYDTMIRVRQNLFVADRFVEFDVSAVDNVLDEIIDDDFIAIRGIATFAAFPVCGQVWNHYLLESYCHRYSKKYRLEVMNYNDKNAGIIVKKNSKLKYKEMLAIVASKAEIPLTVESVGAYLCSTGYMAKSKYAGMGDIVDQAKVLREENH